MSIIVFLIALLSVGQIQVKSACKVNLLIVLDGSTSVCGSSLFCSNWIFALQFVYNIIEGLDIGPLDSMVAFITVSDRARVEWSFNDVKEKLSMLSAIRNIAYLGGDVSETDSLNKLIATQIFNFPAGDGRRAVPAVTVLITDGAPMITAEKGSASSDDFYKTGIKGYVVCVLPGCSESFARSIAQPPKKINETYFLANGYPSIDLVRENLMKQVCST